MKTWIALAAAAAFVFGLCPPRHTQSAPTYIDGTGTRRAVPSRTAGRLRVGVLVMHRTANYLSHPACTELSKRGFLVLCMNSRYIGNEETVRFEVMALDVEAGVQFLRAQTGITKVLLFGHSGGGPTMSFYQALAKTDQATAARQRNSSAATRVSQGCRVPTGSFSPTRTRVIR